MTGSNRVARHAAQRQQRLLAAKVVAAAGFASLSLLGTAARAADVHWNTVDGSWDNALNWLPAAVPVATDRAIVDFVTPGATARVVTTVPDVLAVVVKNGNVLSVQSGTLNTVDNTDANNGVRIGDGGAGTANLTGTGTAVLSTAGGQELRTSPSASAAARAC